MDPRYKTLFEPLRDHPIALLELKGLDDDGFADYFTHPDALIVDTDSAYEHRFDIIIDNAGKVSSVIIANFQTWFPALKPGGRYAIETLYTSYDIKFGREEANENPERPPCRREGRYTTITTMQFLRRLADEVQADYLQRGFRLGFDVGELHFYPNLCIVRKTQ